MLCCQEEAGQRTDLASYHRKCLGTHLKPWPPFQVRFCRATLAPSVMIRASSSPCMMIMPDVDFSTMFARMLLEYDGLASGGGDWSPLTKTPVLHCVRGHISNDYIALFSLHWRTWFHFLWGALMYVCKS